MLQFLRQISVLLKVEKARQPARAFYFDLKVCLKSPSIDPLTGFSISLPEVDQALEKAREQLQSFTFSCPADEGPEFLSQVLKFLQSAFPKSLGLQSFSLFSNQVQYSWQSPWNLDQQVKSYAVCLRSEEDEWALDIAFPLTTSEAALNGYLLELADLQARPAGLSESAIFHGALGLAGNWGLALSGLKVSSRRQHWSILSRL